MPTMQVLAADIEHYTRLVREIAELRGEGAVLLTGMEKRQGRMEELMVQALNAVLGPREGAAGTATPMRARTPGRTATTPRAARTRTPSNNSPRPSRSGSAGSRSGVGGGGSPRTYRDRLGGGSYASIHAGAAARGASPSPSPAARGFTSTTMPSTARSRSVGGGAAQEEPTPHPQPHVTRFQAGRTASPGRSMYTATLAAGDLRTVGASASPRGGGGGGYADAARRRKSPSRAQLQRLLDDPSTSVPSPNPRRSNPPYRHTKKALPNHYKPATAAGASGDRRAAALGGALRYELEGLCREVDTAGMALLKVGQTLRATDDTAGKLMRSSVLLNSMLAQREL